MVAHARLHGKDAGIVSALANIIASIRAAKRLPETERIAAFNAATNALRDLVGDIASDPVLAVQLLPMGDVIANDYNPNKVATPEMTLLRESIESDGVTMPVVVIRDSAHKRWVTVDGFHRQIVLRDHLMRRYIPCSVINTDLANRIAATIRHNRARGKHQVDLMANIVKSLISEGWKDVAIARKIGMTDDELLRLKQNVGIAKLLAGCEYSKSWGPIDEQNLSQPKS